MFQKINIANSIEIKMKKTAQKLLKDFQKLDMNVKYLIGGAIVLLMLFLFWPRGRESGVRLVPVPGTSYYRAIFEQFEVDEAMSSNTPVMAFYSQDWCGYCTKFKPTWKQFQGQDTKGVKIVEIDCAKYPELAKKHKVTGFPTIKYHAGGLNDTNTVEYSGDRSLQSLIDFVKSQN